LKIRWWRLVQITVTIGLTIWLLIKVDWADFVPLIRNLHWELVGLGTLFLIVAHAINVLRWKYLLHQPEISFRTLLSMYGAGLFSNNFLPTGIGGDGVRVILLNRRVPIQQAVVSVFMDRGIGLIALSGLIGLGFWAGLPPSFDSFLAQWLAVAAQPRTPVIVLALLAAFVLAGLVVWRTGVYHRPLQWGTQFLAARGIQVKNWREWMRRAAGAYVISVISNLCIVASVWSIVVALRVELSPAAALWVMIISSLSLLLPIAVNGMGVVEGIYVVVLGSYGLSTSVGLSAALAMRAVTVLLSLVGGILMFDQRAIKTESSM
jgi:uncharacterized protein (TIRG00374 family)